MATVEEVWKGALPPGTHVVAGEQKLRRRVNWSLVLKSRPPGLETPRGGELIILSMRTLVGLDASLSLAGFLSRVAGTATAVAVQGDIDAEALTCADDLGLPLLQLPMDVAMGAVHADVLSFLSEKRSEWYEHKHSILHDLTTLATQGHGLTAIARRMSELTGTAVVFQDETGQNLASFIPPTIVWGPEDVFPPLPIDVFASPSGVGEHPLDTRAVSTTPGGLDQAQVPIVVESRITGRVLMVGTTDQFDDRAQAVLESGATAGAIEMAREHAVLETVDRIQGGLINDLVDGGDMEAPARRARRMGYDVSGVHVAMACSPAFTREEPAPRRHEVLALLRKRLSLVLSLQEVSAPAHTDADALTVFYPVETELRWPELKKRAERLRYALSPATPQYRLRIGVSQCQHGIEGFRVSFGEARRALAVGQALASTNDVTYFGNLGVYRLLFPLAGMREMEDFYSDLLGQLSRYDREKHSELMPTLEAYLYAPNAVEAANRLNLHRNSLAYRLRRIREITGLELDDPDTKLNLHLAFKVGEMLRVEARAKT